MCVICVDTMFFLRRMRASVVTGMSMIVRGGFPSMQCNCLYFVVMSCISRECFLSQEQLRIQTEYQGRIYAVPAFAAYLWSGIVQRVEVVD